MLNEELRQRLAKKISEGEFTSADLPDFLTVFCEVCNESEEVQSEVEAWNAKLQLDITDGDKFWLTITNGNFTCGSGEKDATSAYMDGSLKIGGNQREALKLRGVIGIVLDKLQG